MGSHFPPPPMPALRRPLTLESLEPRTMLSATPDNAASVPLLQEDICETVEKALLNDGHQWTSGEIAAVVSSAAKDASFQSLSETIHTWQDRQNDLSTALSRETLIQDDLSTEQDALLQMREQQALDTVMGDIGNDELLLTNMRQTIELSIGDMLQEERDLHTPHVTAIPLSQGQMDDAGRFVLDVPDIGGSVALEAWQGKSLAEGSFAPASEEDVRRSLLGSGLNPDQVALSPSLSSQLKLREGYQGTASNPLYTLTTHTAALNDVTVMSDTGIRDYWLPRPLRFIDSKNGVICSCDANGDRYGRLILCKEGTFPVTVSFPKGARYVQWIDVACLAGPEKCLLELTRTDGTHRTVTVGASGPVMIDETVQQITLNPQEGSAYGVRAINTSMPSAAPAQNLSSPLRAEGGAFALDLTQSGSCVTGADFRVFSDRPNDPVTVSLYRGESLLSSNIIDPGSPVHVADDAGITSVIFTKRDPESSLTLSSLSLTTMRDRPKPTAAQPSPETNSTLAKASAPAWESGQPYNWADVAVKAGVYFEHGNHQPVGPSGVAYGLGSPNDPSTYHCYEVKTPSGQVRIMDIGYVNETGTHSLPASHWKQIAPNAVVVFPGVSPYLIFCLAGSGTYEFLSASSAATYGESLPPTGYQLSAQVLTLRRCTTEGWQTAPAVVPQSIHANAGDSVNALFRLDNCGLGTGPITARVHVGQAGGSADPVVKEFHGSVGGLSSVALSVNVTIRALNDRVTLEVIGPDGTSCFGGWCVRPSVAQEMTPELEQAAKTTHRWAVLQERISAAMATSPDLVSWREAVAEETSHPIDENSLLDAVKKGPLVASAGMSDSDIIPPGAMTELDTIEQWYDQTGFSAPGVRSDTATGRLFLGLVQKLLPHADLRVGQWDDTLPRGIAYDPPELFLQYHDAADAVERVTGIPAFKILRAANLQKTYTNQVDARDALIASLRDLFITAQYGDIFEQGPLPGQSSVLSCCVDKPASAGGSYTDADTRIRVRFDMTSPDLRYDGGTVTLLDAMGRPLGTPPITVKVTDGLYVDIPMDKIRSLFPNGVFSGRLQVKLSLTEKGSVMTGNVVSEAFTVELRGIRDLSTLPKTEANQSERTAENTVLTILSNPKNFVLQNPGQWRWDIGSPFHDGKDMNAVDLNQGAGNDDMGTTVTCPQDGVVVKNELDSTGNSTLIICHTTTIDKQTTTWYTEYLHMQRIGIDNGGGTLTPLKPGDTVAGGTKIGEVGNVSNANIYSHLHFEVFIGSLNNRAIDLRRLLTENFAMSVTACDAGEDNDQTTYGDNQDFPVVWDQSVGAFVTSESGNNPHLILDRSEQMTDVSAKESRCHWMAYADDPNERKRVVWVHDLPNGHVVNAWLSTDYSQKWNPESRTWESL
jgi:murein DD-endopeptidase MepM/ murein hydrolase activator NlpD